VDMSNGIAVVAAYTGGTLIFDVRQPTAPVQVGSLPGSGTNAFVPRDVQIAGQFALFAEQLFANAVAPIVDISNPSQPFFRGVLDFGQDYAGTGIAISGPFVYWTGQSFVVSAENGTTGTTRLFIGQYIAVEDKNGIAPTVTITQPTDGTAAVEGSQLVVRADAVDDVGVASVTFTVNNVAAFTDTSEPFEARLTVPPVPGPMVVRATAVDYGGNSTTSTAVSINVIPDPLTTVVGRVVRISGVDRVPVAGATVSVGSLTTNSTGDGTFTLPNVPTAAGNIIVQASALIGGTIITGSSLSTAPVPSGTTSVGDILLGSGAPAFALPTPSPFTNGSWAFGEIFTVGPLPITVLSLGVYDAGGNGFVSGSIPVGLYRESDGALLVSTTVSSTDTLLAGFRYKTITPIVLQPGVQYRVVGVSLSDQYNIDFNFTVRPDITRIGYGYVSSTTLVRGSSFLGSERIWFTNFQYQVGGQ
jgi:hypothetical protein